MVGPGGTACPAIPDPVRLAALRHGRPWRRKRPLFGRFNAGIHGLDPLRYEDVAAFYADSPRYGLVEKLTMYGVLGGTPRYHALVDTSRPMDGEIVALLMQPRAVLENEVRFLLGSEQIRDPAPYNADARAPLPPERPSSGAFSSIRAWTKGRSRSI